jgi:hypothetical protein
LSNYTHTCPKCREEIENSALFNRHAAWCIHGIILDDVQSEKDVWHAEENDNDDYEWNVEESDNVWPSEADDYVWNAEESDNVWPTEPVENVPRKLRIFMKR